MRSYDVYYDFEKYITVYAKNYDLAAQKFCCLQNISKTPVEITSPKDHIDLCVEGARMIKNYKLI